MTIKLKVGRNILDISEKDIILDNGACYQITTQTISKGFNKEIPIMSKKMFKEFKKLNYIYTNSELQKMCKEKYKNRNIPLTMYKFNIEQMNRHGYGSSAEE